MVKVKVSIIGAGSATFSVGLIRDLCLTPNLEGSTVSLMDINQERLNAVYVLCRKYADEVGIKLRIEKTTDRRELLRDADFVVNTAMVVGYGGYRAGWQIGFKHGYRFGGSYHIMHDEGFWINYHQFRLFESIAEDILDICPDAWYIKVANPVLAGVTMMGRKYPNLKIIGLCHGYRGIFEIINALGLDARNVTYLIPGVNHFIWLTHFRYKGENAYPLLNGWIEREAEKYWESAPPSSGLGPKAVDLYRRFNVFPIGDTCTPGGGSWPWWYHVDDETENKWMENPRKWWSFVLEPPEKDPIAELIKLAQDPAVNVTSVFPPRKSGESIIDIIESIACDIPRIFQVNIMNSGSLVPGVPCDFEVEVPALVSKRGVQGIKTDGLPKPLIAYILRDRAAPVEMELEAYEAGSRELLLQLIMMDPWTRSKEQAEKLLEDILNLPFNKEMKEHYK
jgi:alpha-galactosidase